MMTGKSVFPKLGSVVCAALPWMKAEFNGAQHFYFSVTEHIL